MTRENTIRFNNLAMIQINCKRIISDFSRKISSIFPGNLFVMSFVSFLRSKGFIIKKLINLKFFCIFFIFIFTFVHWTFVIPSCPHGEESSKGHTFLSSSCHPVIFWLISTLKNWLQSAVTNTDYCTNRHRKKVVNGHWFCSESHLLACISTLLARLSVC